MVNRRFLSPDLFADLRSVFFFFRLIFVRTNAGQKANHEKQDGIQQEKQEEDPDKYQAEEKEDRKKISK